MQNIFLGMLFAFLDLNINLGDATIGLIPDFGWFPLIGGICALAAFVMEICYLVAFNKTKNLYLDLIGLQ